MNQSIEKELHDADYRPLSALSIVAFVIALISAITFFQIAFIPVCVVAFGLAVFAIMRARSEDKEVAGVNLAWAAMFFAGFFFCSTLSARMFEKTDHWTTARGHAEQWFEMIQKGETEQAHHLTLPNYDRQAKDIDLKDYYAPENRKLDASISGRQPQTGYESYWEELYPQKQILKDGQDGKLEFVRNGTYKKIADGQLFSMIYRYTPADPNLKKLDNVGKEKDTTIYFPLEFEIVMHRSFTKNGVSPQWHVFIVRIDGVNQSNTELQLQK